MTDGNTYAINKHLNDQEDYDALQEVTAELEQAEAKIVELEAKLAKAEAKIMELEEYKWMYEELCK
jgi:DNA repair exonuclease SbcCD ATPase subunit